MHKDEIHKISYALKNHTDVYVYLSHLMQLPDIRVVNNFLNIFFQVQGRNAGGGIKVIHIRGEVGCFFGHAIKV